ncbi:MAG: GNAT family N-acetyltransferase [Acidimicrobiia bacterium]
MTGLGDALANPVWHALGGAQSALAEAKGAARRYQPDVSIFCALPDAPAADDWGALRALVGPGEDAFLIREEIAPPDGWVPTFELDCVQMVLDGEIAAGPVPDHVVLGPGDVTEMTDLVARTEPGPWRPRTIQFGGYVGVRDAGALVAMAGERMRPPGFAEVSAVCTEPAYRGRGLAGGLTRVVARAITARGECPMLHASTGNASAVRLYESLGFRRTYAIKAMALRVPI